ncbi:hypothetical protein ABW21_db0202378 [Orbilia brochopaga]|nr:hypothetical protein ABW21_db0202378 [Drechslerella brochopaga]
MLDARAYASEQYWDAVNGSPQHDDKSGNFFDHAVLQHNVDEKANSYDSSIDSVDPAFQIPRPERQQRDEELAKEYATQHKTSFLQDVQREHETADNFRIIGAWQVVRSPRRRRRMRQLTDKQVQQENGEDDQRVEDDKQQDRPMPKWGGTSLLEAVSKAGDNGSGRRTRVSLREQPRTAEVQGIRLMPINNRRQQGGTSPGHREKRHLRPDSPIRIVLAVTKR